ncbi:MAG: IclR family transcriptional regulator [Pseudomonadota bacterium]|nr:IclR family transcriptional regulator [Pseudomonadota bacterium]
MIARARIAAQPRNEANVAKPGSVAATLAILRLLAKCDGPVGVNTIARELTLAPSSCFKILKQLQRADFVDFDERSKCYSLGVGAIELARRALDPNKAFSIIRPRLDQVADQFAVAIGFWRGISHSRIVLAGFVEGNSPMRIHMSVGQRLPMLMGAVGRAIAANLGLGEMELRREFGRLRWQSQPKFEDYVAQVEEARRRGFAVDRDNFATGVTTVAVAIHDSVGAVSYGLSGIMFSGQCDEESIVRVGEALVDVAAWAASRLTAG